VTWADWVRGVELEPSIYAADFSRLGEQVDALLAAGCRIFHWDVGDGHFIPPITMGPIVLESIAERVHEASGVLDCHLMVAEPVKHVQQFAEAGGDSVTVHYEVTPDLPDIVGLARAHGLQAVHGGIVAEDVVAHFRAGHGLAHRGRRLRDGVAAEVESAHGNPVRGGIPIVYARIARRRGRARGMPSAGFR